MCGYGDVGKGCAQSLRGQGARVVVTEIDPICALQAAMEGYEVKTVEDVVETADLFVTATGNKNVISVEHMARMKHNAIVGNIGHFDTEIDMAGLAKVPGGRTGDHEAPGGRVGLPAAGDRPTHSIIVLAEGRLLNLGCATGHPSFVMSNSFTNQVIAQMELFGHRDFYERRVYTLPKHLDEEVARLHLDKLGVRLTALSEDQATYLGVPSRAPTSPTTTATDAVRRFLRTGRLPVAHEAGECLQPSRTSAGARRAVPARVPGLWRSERAGAPRVPRVCVGVPRRRALRPRCPPASTRGRPPSRIRVWCGKSSPG